MAARTEERHCEVCGAPFRVQVRAGATGPGRIHRCGLHRFMRPPRKTVNTCEDAGATESYGEDAATG